MRRTYKRKNMFTVERGCILCSFLNRNSVFSYSATYDKETLKQRPGAIEWIFVTLDKDRVWWTRDLYNGCYRFKSCMTEEGRSHSLFYEYHELGWKNNIFGG